MLERKFTAIGVLLLATSLAAAQTTWTGSASASWADSANWSAGVPTASLGATIPAGTPNSPSTAGAAGAECLALAVNGGATLTIVAAYPLNVNSSASVAGSIAGGGLLRFVGSTGEIGINSVLPNVEIAVAGTFTSSIFSAASVKLVSGAWVVQYPATISGSAELLGGTLSVPAALDVAGDVTFSGTSCSSVAHVQCGGNWIGHANFDPSAGMVSFDGPGTPQSISGSCNFYDLTVIAGASVAATVSLSVDNNWQVGGSLTLVTAVDCNGPSCTILSGGTLSAPNGIHTFAGYFLAVGPFVTPSTSIVRFDGSTGNTGSFSVFPHVEIAVTSSFHSAQFTAATVKHLSGAWTVQYPATVLGSAELLGGTISAPAVLDVAGDVTFSGTSCSSVAHVQCGGNWIGHANFDPSAGMVSFDGPGTPQSISGSCNFYDLTVIAGANVAATVSLSVDNNWQVGGSLTLVTPVDCNGPSCTILSGGTLSAPNGIHTFAGYFLAVGPFVTPSTSIVRFDGSTGNTGSFSVFPHVEIAVTSSFHSAQFTAATVKHLSGDWVCQYPATVLGSAELLGGTISAPAVLDVAGDVTFSGTSCSGVANVQCGGNWIGHANFDPSAGMVSFDGPGTPQSISGSCNFYDLTVIAGASVEATVSLSADNNWQVGGSLTLVTPVDCNGPSCTILSGGTLSAPNGIHTFAGYFLAVGPFVTPSTSIVRFDGSTGNTGSFSVFPHVEIAVTSSFHSAQFTAATVKHLSGAWTVQYPATVLGSAELLGGTISAPAVLDVAGDVTFSGTSCSGVANVQCGGNWTADAGFNPSAGTVSFDGSGVSTLNSSPPGGTVHFVNLVVYGSVTPGTDLTLRSANIEIYGTLATLDKRLVIHRPSGPTSIDVPGLLSVAAGGELALGPSTSVLVSGNGWLHVIGSCGAPAVIAGEAGGGYAFTVQTNGGVAASNFVFKEMGPNGIFVNLIGTIAPPPHDFRGGTFDYPSSAANAPLLRLGVLNFGSHTFRYIRFQNTPGHPTAKNVLSNPSSPGIITFSNFSGALAGPAFEDDAGNRITWAPPDPGLPLGLCDTDPPHVAITAPADGAVSGVNSVAVTANVTDENGVTVTSTPAGISATLPAGGGPVSGTLPLLAEGPNTLTVAGADEFGNVGGTSVTVILDTTNPLVTIDSPTEGAVSGSDTVAVTVTVVDATATQVTIGTSTSGLSAGGGIASASVTLTEGSNAITVTVVDAGGNTATAVRNVIYDVTAPAVVITSPADGAAFGSGQSPISVAAFVTDATETTVSSVPAGVTGTVAAGGGTATGSVALVEGANTISVTATDAAAQSGVASISVILDTTPPSVAVEAPAQGSVVRGTIDFHATAADVAPGTGVSRVDLFVDNVLAGSLTAPPFEIDFDTTALADGSHTFSATAFDGKNNSASASVTVVVDNTAPVITISQPAHGTLVSGSVNFVATVSDSGSGVSSVSMRGNGLPPTVDGSTTYATPVASDERTSQVDTTALPDGLLLLAATVTDAAGNTASADVTVYVDNTAPAKALITPIDGSVVSGVMLILGTANDPNLDILGIFVNEVLVAITSSSTISAAFDTALVLDGSLTVTLVAVDTLGNASSCSATVTVDNIPGFILTPRTLNLKSKSGDHSVTAHLEGSNVGLLIPTEAHAIELRVPGGSPVASTAGFSGDDATSDSDEDGIPELTIKFNRQALIASIKAGVAANMIQPNSQVTVTLVSAGSVIGTDVIRIIGP